MHFGNLHPPFLKVPDVKLERIDHFSHQPPGLQYFDLVLDIDRRPVAEDGEVLERFELAAHRVGFLGQQDFGFDVRSEEHTSELQSRENLVCRLLLEKKKDTDTPPVC